MRAWAIADRGDAGGDPGPGDFGGGPVAHLLEAPPEPDTPVRICPRGHVNPPGALLCLEADCGEDMPGADIVYFGARGRKPPGLPVLTCQPDEPLVIYPEEEQLEIIQDVNAGLAASGGDAEALPAEGADLLEGEIAVAMINLRMVSRDGKWYATNLSDIGAYVNGVCLEKGATSEVDPGDEVRVTAHVDLKVAP
ncbi:MAG: hypothetical protein LBT40_17720 [Deltaproteobacteria bacterium]|nr:hypothetical protein [Deltaproteobacteria bacterium]